MYPLNAQPEMVDAKQSARIRQARALLWLGAFMPIIYTVGKGVDEVGGVGPLEIIRGGGGLALFFFVTIGMRVPATRPLRNGLTEAGLFFFVAMASLSALWSVDPRLTILKLVPLVTTYLCLAKLSTLYISIQETIRGIVTVAHSILLATLVQLAVWPSRTYSTDNFGQEPRIHSVLPAIASNLFGLIAGIGIAAICLKIGPKWTTRAPWNILLVLVYFVLLLGTRSRVVTLVSLIIIILCLVRAMHRSQHANILGWFGATAAVAGGWWAWTRDDIKVVVAEFVLRGQDEQGLSTLTGRTVIWDRVPALITGDEWWGWGYYAGHRVGLPARDSLFRGYSNLDNTWIESVVGVGLLGAGGLAVFMLFGTIRTIKATRGMGSYRLFAVLLTLGVTGLTLINPTVQTNTSTLVFFAIIVFTTRALKEESPPLACANRHQFIPTELDNALAGADKRDLSRSPAFR
ncbi:O-antigen ligase family protein [Rhodococcus pyridinivorans]|uniref:O-antigen ligase family protein n=1 Tax=Rhodococcus pyridinivorans TaxID=103816 RepID=UPI003D7FB64A